MHAHAADPAVSLELADLPLQARPDSRLTAGEHRYTAVVRQIREKEDAVYTLRVRLCSMDDAPLDGARGGAFDLLSKDRTALAAAEK